MEGELEIVLESTAKENRKMQALLQATWRGEAHSTPELTKILASMASLTENC